ncbi:hypothetical protein PAXRUDRAFT_834589 [Paxillus rubicundulus Ve08.2h10]|uniref:Uncharacterized protein n=1 Tax=Paxillus rubicundulus Ve08.2h10 TaxID=930991 RepID=A0A0D0C5F3_9AGAM|nr:hypothetical protein PAXRUDRAFT_834589 [Paxillus rubicundulus Ve08.2h10]
MLSSKLGKIALELPGIDPLKVDEVLFSLNFFTVKQPPNRLRVWFQVPEQGENVPRIMCPLLELEDVGRLS